MILVGNKIDMTREVSTEEGQKLAEFYKIPFFETSAKENIGITESIRCLIEEVLESFRPREATVLKPDNESKGKCAC
jgi:GTPase SAR1 family protein